MILDILIDLNFISALSGLIGTILIFFFGLPPSVDLNGSIYLILEQDDHEEKIKAKKYKSLSYLGLLLIGISFLLQIINTIINYLS